MMNWCGQFKLLLKKNLRVQIIRSKVWFAFQLILPLLFIIPLITVIINLRNLTVHNETQFSAVRVAGDRSDLLEEGVRGVDVGNLDRSLINYRNRTVAFAPRSEFVIKLATEFDKRFASGNDATLVTEVFDTEVDMMKRLREDANKSTISHMFKEWTYLAGIVVDQSDNNNNMSLSYAIRMARGVEWYIGAQWPSIVLGGARAKQNIPDRPEYWRLAFLTIQRAVDEIFIEMVRGDGGVQNDSAAVYVHQMPYPSYKIGSSSVIAMFISYLPLYLSLVLLATVVHTAREIAADKETGVKQYLTVMGLRPGVFYLSHFATAACKVLPVCTLIGLLLLAILNHTDPSLLIISILLYGFGAIAFAILVSSVFHSTSAALRWGLILWMTTIGFMMSTLAQPVYPLGVQMLFSLNLNSAFGYSMAIIGAHENLGQSLRWGQLFTGLSPENRFSLALGWIMLLFDISWMLLTALYLDAVYPPADAPKLPPWFCFLPRYWRSHKKKDVSEMEDDNIDGGVCSAAIERDEAKEQSIVPNIRVCNLSKIWNDGWCSNAAQRPAVDAISFRAYRGQITALLGHNGAGKSTFFGVICGLTRPTRGDAFVENDSIRDSMSAVRKHLGLCPQQSCLIHKLTVVEHLRLFCSLKGRTVEDEDIEHLLTVLDLTQKRHALAETLSGGQKRKLSLAIAVVGGSEVLLLDEPTAGMDPSARHAAWSLLQQLKMDRTILLTTHYMEEADLLADRIAIMVKGRLSCMGTPMYLKNLFGYGYTLVALANSDSGVPIEQTQERTFQILSKCFAGVKMKQIIGQEISFLLPIEARSKFSALFEQLESEQERLNVKSFGVSATSLEEVFLKVGDSDEIDIGKDGTDTGTTLSKTIMDRENNDEKRETGLKSVTLQCRAMLLKRYALMRRKWRGFLCQFILLLLAMAFFVFGNKIVSSENGQLRLKFDASVFSPSRFLMRPSANDSFEQVQQNLIALAVRSGLTVQNFTGSMNSYVIEQYGKLGQLKARHDMVVGAEITDEGQFTLLFSGQAYHSVAVALSLYSNAILKSIDQSASISTYNELMTNRGGLNDIFGKYLMSSLTAVALVIFLCLFVCDFVKMAVHERLKCFKQLQLMAGLHPVIYWLSFFFCDLLLSIIFASILLLLIWIGSVYVLSDYIGVLYLLVIVYCLVALFQLYCISFIMSSGNKAYALALVVSLAGSAVALIVVTLIQAATPASPDDTTDTNVSGPVLSLLLFLLPTFALGTSLFRVFIYNRLDTATVSVFKWTFVGQPLFFMIISSLFWCFCIFAIEIGWCRLFLRWLTVKCRRRTRKPNNGSERTPESYEMENSRVAAVVDGGQRNDTIGGEDEEDEDIRAERFRAMSETSSLIKAVNLSKWYGNLHAVKRLTFIVNSGDCFGLLGVNGAGKTTTFEMLTGRVPIDRGQAFVNGRAVGGAYLSRAGYCPQSDALLDDLTCRQILHIIALLRHLSQASSKVDQMLAAVNLQEHSGKTVTQLSGGNKRRLSVAAAILGEPRVVMLDEPSAGVDPVARRLVWDLLTDRREQGAALLLTSHSMEECEALCTRIGILIAGRLHCIGTAQHIKSKFGGKSTLTLKMKSVEEVGRGIARVQTVLPNALLREQHLTQITFDVYRQASDKWSALFGKVNSVAAELDAVDYSLSQCTLEQAFIELNRSAVLGSSTDAVRSSESIGTAETV